MEMKHEHIAVTLERPSLAIHVTWSFVAANPVYFMAFMAFLVGAGAAAFLAAFITFMAFMAFGMVKKETMNLQHVWYLTSFARNKLHRETT